MSSSIIIDASLAVYSVLRTSHSESADRVMNYFAHNDTSLFAPGLWWFEVTSVVHRYLHSKLVSDMTAHSALEILTSGLGVQLLDVPCRAAFDWATRLGQKAAYDGFYLAAAERLGAPLWTADQALVNNTRQIGIDWVYWMGEMQ